MTRLPAACRPLLPGLLACLLIAGTSLVQAADSPTPARADTLAPARAQIAQGHWAEAIEALRRLDDTRNADWHNLMGYSLRKSSPPDLPAAERHYDEALRLNPQHRGALEYSGELYLMLGDLPRAEARLAALDKACFLPCEEFNDLKRAIARYKAGR